MNTRWWRMVRLMVTMLSLTMLVGLASPVGAQDTDPKDDCKQGGWETLTTADGEAFDNQGNCVSYVAADGGVPVAPASGPTLTLTVLEPTPGADGYCTFRASFLDFKPDAVLHVEATLNNSETVYLEVPVDGNGNFDFWNIVSNDSTLRFTVSDPYVSTGDVPVNC